MGSPKENALGDASGQFQTILGNESAEQGKYDPIRNIWSYYTQGLNQGDLDQRTNQVYDQAQNSLYGQQQRTAGNAGALASNQAFASGVSNPYAFSSHAQNGVYQGYADVFGGLKGNYLQQMMQNPQIANRSQLAANQSNFQNLYQLLMGKTGIAAQRDTGLGEALIAGGLKAGSALVPGLGAMGGGAAASGGGSGWSTVGGGGKI